MRGNQITGITGFTTPTGRRVCSGASGVYSDYYYNADWQMLQESITGATTATARYVWSDSYVDDLVLRDKAGTRLYAQQDGAQKLDK